MAQHPDGHRTALSLHLRELWNWRSDGGRLQDMAARTLLLKLQARGPIELPPPQKRTARPCARAPARFQPELRPVTATPRDGPLPSWRPLRLELGQTTARTRQDRHRLLQPPRKSAWLLTPDLTASAVDLVHESAKHARAQRRKYARWFDAEDPVVVANAMLIILGVFPFESTRGS